jgi:hypothetical protein
MIMSRAIPVIDSDRCSDNFERENGHPLHGIILQTLARSFLICDVVSIPIPWQIPRLGPRTELSRRRRILPLETRRPFRLAPVLYNTTSSRRGYSISKEMRVLQLQEPCQMQRKDQYLGVIRSYVPNFRKE